MKREILQAEIDLLESFEFTNAYTGELGKLKQKSYVEYDKILILMNKKKAELKELTK